MYDLKARINAEDGDQLLDDLVALFEAHHQDCTCGVVGDADIGSVAISYVEEELLSKVTAIMLCYAKRVHVQRVEDEALVAA
ncbi:MAG: hypothetical protein U0350_39065 [Caldilineaceae bacterium]